MIDSKIKIYMKFQVKKGLIFLGGKNFAPFFGILPPNFGPIVPQNPAETAPNLGPREEFQKSQRYYCSSAIGLGVHRKKVQFRVKTTMPHPKR